MRTLLAGHAPFLNKRLSGILRKGAMSHLKNPQERRLMEKCLNRVVKKNPNRMREKET